METSQHISNNHTSLDPDRGLNSPVGSETVVVGVATEIELSVIAEGIPFQECPEKNWGGLVPKRDAVAPRCAGIGLGAVLAVIVDEAVELLSLGSSWISPTLRVVSIMQNYQILYWASCCTFFWIGIMQLIFLIFRRIYWTIFINIDGILAYHRGNVCGSVISLVDRLGLQGDSSIQKYPDRLVLKRRQAEGQFMYVHHSSDLLWFLAMLRSRHHLELVGYDLLFVHRSRAFQLVLDKEEEPKVTTAGGFYHFECKLGRVCWRVEGLDGKTGVIDPGYFVPSLVIN